MKSLKILSIIMLSYSMNACAQNESSAPVKVKAAFNKKYPEAQSVKWGKENESEWEAEFKIKKVAYSANFLTDGTWQETEYEIKKSALPDNIKKTLENEFSGYDMEEIEISETPEGKVYEFALEKDETDFEVVISTDGKVVKKEMKKEEDEDDEK